MGFLDSSSSIVTAILTRKGRELLAKNNGSFRITKFAMGDDEINYQLFDPATNSDANILNLPILEPSSNENTALRYRLITAPRGTTRLAYLIAAPAQLVLQNSTIRNPRQSTIGAISVSTVFGVDSSYSVVIRDPAIAQLRSINLGSSDDGTSSATIIVAASSRSGSTYADIVGSDTGAIISIPIIVTSVQVAET